MKSPIDPNHETCKKRMQLRWPLVTRMLVLGHYAWGRLRQTESDPRSVRERLMVWLDQVPME